MSFSTRRTRLEDVGQFPERKARLSLGGGATFPGSSGSLGGLRMTGATEGVVMLPGDSDLYLLYRERRL